jgi:tetratricopeptide (TPR) repeat protein
MELPKVTHFMSSFFPPDRTKVYGRDHHIAKLLDEITNGINYFLIVGPPGVGKSTVGAALLYHKRSKERFNNRRHWACFKDVTTIDDFFNVLCNALCMNADTSSSGITSTPPFTSPDDRLRALTGGLQTSTAPRLLILDDLDSVWEGQRILLESALQQLTAIVHLTIIVTMQGSVALPQATSQVELPTLPPRDAKLLFLAVYPHPDPVIDELVKQLDFHPLSIMVTARMCQLHGAKPSEVLKRWKNSGLDGLPNHTTDVGDVATLKGTINDSFSRLSSPEATKLLRIISALPMGIMAKDLAGIAPSIHNIDDIAGMLKNCSLTSIDEGQHLRVLSPIKSYVVNYHELDRQSRNELYFYYFDLAKAGLSRPGDDYFLANIQKLLLYQQNIEAILSHALEDGDVPAIEATLHYSSPGCAIRPRLDLVQKALDAAKKNESLTMEQAIRDGSMALVARCLQHCGELNLESGNFIEMGTLFREAIERFEKMEDPRSVARCEILLAQHLWINDQKKAIEDLEGVRERLVTLADAEGEARCLLKLAEYYLGEQRIQEAREACQRSIALSKDRHHKMLCQRILAKIYHQEGHLEDARSLLVGVIDTLTKFGDRSASAECQVSLSSVYTRLQRIEDAQKALKQAIIEYDALGKKLKAAFARRSAANISEDEEAIKLLQEAIPTFWESAFTFAGAESRLDLGLRCMNLGRLDDALLHFQIARPQLQRNNTPNHAANCLLFMILCHMGTGDEENANLVLEEGKYELHAHLGRNRTLSYQPEDMTLPKLVSSYFGTTELEFDLSDSDDLEDE